MHFLHYAPHYVQAFIRVDQIRIERVRLWLETFSAPLVGFETHSAALALICFVWFAVDLYAAVKK